GVPVNALEKREGYVYAVKHVAGESTLAVLPKLCTDLLDSLRWGKAMRWNSSGVAYPRPLRWIVALYGNQPVRFTWAGIQSGTASRGTRFADAMADLKPGEFTTFPIKNAGEYFAAVAGQGIIVNRDERRSMIRRLVE